MDHARHMSSPSPTSSFLFQHSDRSFKSSLLTSSLLTSASDVSDLDDCYSTNSNTDQMHGRLGTNFGDTNDEGHQAQTILVSDDEHNVAHGTKLDLEHEQHRHFNQQQHQQSCNVIEQDSLNGVENEAELGDEGGDDDDDDDDVEGMQNMLSASSASSTATMPLLTDGHSHNPFSRISLEEYSPLSLVDECDNTLAISPNSLACGPNHPFKTSLSNLKMDNLDGVDVGVHDHDDDVVCADARSMSPTLLSATTNALHHHLWSNSSTAITQNPALLSSSSTSFLLSHHHHHHQQLNSLMQQLEPQSLDESPPLLTTGSSIELDHGMLGNNRPSSEPPHGCGLEINGTAGGGSSSSTINNLETKSLSSQSSASTILLEQPPSRSQANGSISGSKSKATNTADVNQLPAPPSSRSSRRNRSRATSSSTSSSPLKQQLQANLLNSSTKTSNGRSTGKQQQQQQQQQQQLQQQTQSAFGEQAHCSKVHLQLNHHQKLKELQQRLFGTNAATTTTANVSQEVQTASVVKQTSTNKVDSDNGQYSSQGPANSSETQKSQMTSTTSTTKQGEEADSSASVKQTSTQTNGSGARVRTRSTPRRRSRGAKSEASGISDSASSNKSANSTKPMQIKKIVATETAEPDTTTTTSDCIKLAGLLRTSNGVEAKNPNISMMLSNTYSSDSDNVCDRNSNSDKRIQHIQLQVSPSLTVVSNGSLMQPISMPQMSNNGNVVCSGALDSQVLCRPMTVMTPMNSTNISNGPQLIVSNEESVNRGSDGSMLSNWNNAQQSNNGVFDGTSGSSSTNGATMAVNNTNMGTHQIAIQVICQDGTSLVLPVSSAATLSGLSLAPHSHQQLQAILGNGNSISNQQQQSRNILPLVSVANIVAQQQSTLNEASSQASASTSSSSQINATSASNATQTSGLAASSPTLAALLDAGSARGNTGLNFNGNGNGNAGDMNISSPQSIVSTNLLRKLISGNQTNLELKRGEINIQSNAQVGLANSGSLITVCTTSASNLNVTAVNSSGKTTHNATCTNGEKRIKLENNGIELGNGCNLGESSQAIFTLVDSQGLVVANGNDVGGKLSDTSSQQKSDPQQTSATCGNSQLGGNNIIINGTGGIVGPTSLKQQLSSAPSKSTSNSDTNTCKQSKMTSSTGNRQVDPTQPFRCEHCNSTFTRLGNFTRHKKIHTVPIKDGQRFKCDVCSKSFLQRCDLARHLHIHRGTEPHRCNICGKGYIRHSDLVTHQRFHNKEKPFGCPHCSKGFCQRGDLNRHLRSIHLQMKPILCPCCNRKFAKQETLLRHLNTAHRARPGGPNSVIAEVTASNYSMGQGVDKQQHATLSLVTTAPSDFSTDNINDSNNNVDEQKTVTSLQAIQATLCKVQQSADPSIAVKVEIPTTDGVVS